MLFLFSPIDKIRYWIENRWFAFPVPPPYIALFTDLLIIVKNWIKKVIYERKKHL